MIFEIIDKSSPLSLVDRVFVRLRILLKDLYLEYPFFEQWLIKVQRELINSDQRCILICSENNTLDIIGLAILKRTEQERKICTLRVLDGYKRKHIGTILLRNSLLVLHDNYPLITVSGTRMKEYSPFLKKFGFKIMDKVKSIYKRGSYEYFFNVPYKHKIALMSIRPQYAQKIADGMKKVEFRKKIFSDSVEKVYVYSSSPVKKIIGYFNVNKVKKAAPNELWEQYSQVGFISSDDFQSYYRNHKIGYGIEIDKFFTFCVPVDPNVLNPKFRAPQSFCYIDNVEEIESLDNRKCNLVK